MHFPTLAIVGAIFIPAFAIAAGPKTVDVTMFDFPSTLTYPPKFAPRFDPDKVVINIGDTVRWTNKGNVPHTVDAGPDCSALAEDQEFSSKKLNAVTRHVMPGGTFEHTFDKA
ncbi:hypothetical protein BGZ97_009376, partial [Linnemannia gamsii]